MTTTQRAPGPFKVVKSQYLTHSDVHLRTYESHPRGGWRVATIFDGWYDVAATASFFGAAEEMYNALKGIQPLSKYVVEAMTQLLAARVPPEKLGELVRVVTQAFADVDGAIIKADTPIADIPGEPKASEPTYNELIAAVHDIRRIVGDGTVPPQGVVDVEADWIRLAEILEVITPKALRPVTDVVEEAAE